MANNITRRGALKAGATVVGGAAATGVLSSTAEAADLHRFEGQFAVDPKQRILLKGGIIISMDAKVGDFAQGDLLIEGKKIAAIAPSLNAADAQVIDARDTIIVPGFVDCHRHSWEAPLRRINPNSPTLADYSNATHLSFAKSYRPQDHYVANYLTAVGCIDAGITCVIDNSHNSRSAAHSDAAVEALIESGVRAVHASGAALRRRVGPSMAPGSRTAAEEIFLLDRPTRDVAHVLGSEPRQLGPRAQARPAHYH